LRTREGGAAGRKKPGYVRHSREFEAEAEVQDKHGAREAAELQGIISGGNLWQKLTPHQDEQGTRKASINAQDEKPLGHASAGKIGEGSELGHEEDDEDDKKLAAAQEFLDGIWACSTVHQFDSARVLFTVDSVVKVLQGQDGDLKAFEVGQEGDGTEEEAEMDSDGSGKKGEPSTDAIEDNCHGTTQDSHREHHLGGLHWSVEKFSNSHGGMIGGNKA